MGLTATLVREDGREDDVFALIGPKKVDVPWKVLEGEGWIATAACTESACRFPRGLRMPYAVADAAAEVPHRLGEPAQIGRRPRGPRLATPASPP